ncbi:hypothetical protein M9H77_10775 [Catharanthus roseus]|uniref:Uncharacterized protein n=1 Tax=Catharanthus roseus TaxID=4058 RepID=A0ACC0BCN1_CATRO|nr:hypothetical protein M9H77_10775 [Catharanthus roseus]
MVKEDTNFMCYLLFPASHAHLMLEKKCSEVNIWYSTKQKSAEEEVNMDVQNYIQKCVPALYVLRSRLCRRHAGYLLCSTAKVEFSRERTFPKSNSCELYMFFANEKT